MLLAFAYVSLGILSVVCTLAYFKLRISQDQFAQNPNFVSFQRRYVVIYLLAVLGDWLQGPYLYRLYHYYEYIEHQVAVIYVSGLVSSAVSYLLISLIGKKYGRRNIVMVCCLLYALSCLFTAFSSYAVLLIGRCIAGLSNTLLFSTLEAWYVHEHLNTFDFPKEWIQVTFNHIAFGNGIMAVIAGLLADFFARWLKFGPVSPFLIAVPVLITVSILVLLMWNENKQNESTEGTSNFNEIKNMFKDGVKSLTPDIFIVGISESLYESAIFVFVFIWTPAIGGNVKNPVKANAITKQGLYISDIPLGVTFASFMVCFILGGIIYNNLAQRSKFKMSNLLLPISGTSAFLFFVCSFLSHNKNPSAFIRSLIVICLQLLEFGCGFYFPIMRALRNQILPEEHRSSIIIIFRLPLIILSSLALLLLHDSTGGIMEIFLYGGILLLIAFICSFRFLDVKSQSNTSDLTNDYT